MPDRRTCHEARGGGLSQGPASDEPVVLLDDVLSELDIRRRAEVLDMTSQYEQVFITATDAEHIGEPHISRMSRFVVRDGEIESLPCGRDERAETLASRTRFDSWVAPWTQPKSSQGRSSRSVVCDCYSATGSSS